MKPPERFPPDDPREWLNRAKGNLAKAKVPVPGGYLEDLCFDAQQASEKAIKALLIARHVDFPYTHDLSRLLTVPKPRGKAFRTPYGEPRNLPTTPHIPAIPVLKNPFPNPNIARP